MIPNQDGLTLEDRVKKLEQTNAELLGVIKAMGGQITELKKTTHGLEVDIAILKQGGNL